MLEELTAPRDQILKFWKLQNFKKNPQFSKELEFWDGLDLKAEVPIPLLLHGDSASYSETDSVMVVSIRCLLSKRSIQTSHLLVGCLPKQANADSWGPLWRSIAESLAALALGHHPELDGPLRKCIVASISGDLERFAQEFNWPPAGANHLCPFCQADNFHDDKKSLAPYNDFRPNASWRALAREPPDCEPRF